MYGATGAADELLRGEQQRRQPRLPSIARRRPGTFASFGTLPDASEQKPLQPQPTLEGTISDASNKDPLGNLQPTASWGDSDQLSADTRREFVEGLLSCPEFAYDEKIDHAALRKGRQKLLDALSGSCITGGVEEELPNILNYKNRPLFSARVLHLAVWCSTQLREASLLELVLKHCKETDLDAKAKYTLPSRTPGWTTQLQLDALHLACGLGSLPAVDVLVRHVCFPEDGPSRSSRTPPSMSKPTRLMREYVNMHTIIEYCEEKTGKTKKEQFYQPLHEATDKGFVDVAMYLLDCGAEGGRANKDGLTPLHFVAMRGSASSIRSVGCEVLRKVVHMMQEAGASLETRVKSSHYNPRWAGKTPLELAAADDSRFPRQMMGLLVPCLQDSCVSVPRFCSDIAFLSALDAEAATGVVHEIRARTAKNNNVLQRFRMDAQTQSRTDEIAGILFLAPEAGVMMMEMLVGDPEVQDVSKHNIPTRTSLYGFWKHLPMRCIYRGDAIQGSEHVSLPMWNYDISKPFEQQPNIAWHKWLVPERDGVALREDHVYNARVRVVLLPNVLDLDMFAALGRVRQTDIQVFSKLSVRGMIYCLWNNLVDNIWIMETIFQMVELVTLMWWGLAWPLVGPRADTKADRPLCWAIICAGTLRELLQLMLALLGCLRKYWGHSNATMRSLWHPFSELFVPWAMPKLLLVALQFRFAVSAAAHLGDTELSDVCQVTLAFTVLVKSAHVIYLFRLCAGGSKIYAIFHSFLGGATREMLSITAMIFASFSLAFLVLVKDKAVGWVFASSYRGLLFGDGDGFNNLGLDVDEDGYNKNNPMLTVFLVVGSFIFNVILLNLIIAVYGNEYDKVATQTEVLFLHGRARNCVTMLMSCQLFPWVGLAANLAMKGLAFASVASGIALHVTHIGTPWTITATCLFATGQVLFQASLAQCEWFSVEGIAADGSPHFLWICHRDVRMETTDATEALQLGLFEDKLSTFRTHVDERFSALEQKLDLVLQRFEG